LRLLARESTIPFEARLVANRFPTR